jgi:hypothetical protein
LLVRSEADLGPLSFHRGATLTSRGIVDAPLLSTGQDIGTNALVEDSNARTAHFS